MVTLQAKQQPPEHQQQQQRLSELRQRQREQEAVADEDNCWKWQQRPNGENKEISKCGINENWTISELESDNLTINNKDESRKNHQVATIREEISTRSAKESRSYGEVATGSNSESTQCSDIDEGDDDVEIEEELEEEEEEEEEEGGKYEVDEVDTDDEDDDDDDKEAGNQVEKSDRWIKKKVVTTKVQHQTSFGESYGQSVAVPNLDATAFGEVSITNSKHVHVGNTNFYKGPVTIKQFVYTNAYPVLDKEDDNEGSSSARVSDINPNDVPIVKCDPNGPIFPSYRDYDTVTKWLWTWRCAAILSVVALSLVTIVAVVSVLLTHNTSVPPRPPNKVPESPGTGDEDNDLPPGAVRIIQREFWNAQPPSKELDKLHESPTPYVIISHTATGDCNTQSACVLKVRLIQTLHIESFGWDDIGYNFLVGGDGLAYLARGWDNAGAHAYGYNYKSIGISFIGTFNDVVPNKLQITAARKLIEHGLNISKISPTYKLLGHRQVSKTLSPGDRLYEIIQTWDHWSPVPRPLPVSRAATANRPHPAAILPLIIIIIPHLLLILQRSSRILFSSVHMGFCNIYYFTYEIYS